MWLKIVTDLLAALGPILSKLFREWLESKLKAEAARLEREGERPLSERTNRLLLLDRVARRLWFWQAGKKTAVAQARAAVYTDRLKTFDGLIDG